MEKILVNESNFNEIYDNPDLFFCEKILNNYEKGMYVFANIYQEAEFVDAIATSYSACLTKNSIKAIDEYCFFTDDNHYKPIKLISRSFALLRKAGQSDIQDALSPDTMISLYNNMAYHYSLHNRYCDVIKMYNKALSINPKNGMIRYNRVLYLKQHLFYIFKFCSLDKLYNFFVDELSNVYDNLTPDFEDNRIKSIEKDLSDLQKLHSSYSQEKFITSPDLSTRSNSINPIVEIFPKERLPGEQDVILENLINNDKYVELVRAFLLLEFETHLLAIHTYPEVMISRKYSTLIVQFYSFFDKISYFLNDYYKVGIDPKKVSINNIFTFKNSKLLSYRNPFLYSIYWVAKEYRIDKINEFLDPLYLDFNELRNKLEHRCEPINSDSSENLEQVNKKLEQIVHDMLIHIQMMNEYEESLKIYGNDSSSVDFRSEDISFFDFFSNVIRGNRIK